MKPTFQRVALAAALGFGLVVSAAAQDRGPGAGAAAAGARGGDRQKLFADMQHKREQRLHDLLQIKSDQETAFHTYVTALEQARPQRGQRQGGRRDGGPGAGGPGGAQRMPLTAPERLDRSAQRLAEAQQRLQKESAAVKTFYAVLSPDQRKVFDEFPAMDRGHGHGFGGRGRFMRSRFDGPPIR